MIQEYQFGKWLPEAADYKNPGLEDARNVLPSPSGYKPARTEAQGATVSGTIIGAFATERADGTTVVCVATTADLFVVIGGTTTASSLALSLAATDRVVFERFNAKVYASTRSGDTWVLDDVESDTSFAAATGSPPNANAMGKIGDFLWLGNLSEGGTFPYRARWSQFNNPDGSWVADIATQSGSQDLERKFGPITAIAGGDDFGLLFQQTAVSRVIYTGGATVWNIERYEENRGCVAGASVVKVGDRVYYLSFDAFCVTDGSSVQSISTGRIWEWFKSRLNATYMPYVVGGLDLENRCIVWAFPTGGNQTLTVQLVYQWETDSWSYIEAGCQWLLASRKAGLTLEQVAAVYTNLDTMPTSLDSPEFQPQGNALSAFVDGRLCTYSGPTREAILEAGEMQPVVGRRSFVRNITPLIEAEDQDVQVAVRWRDRMTASKTQDAYRPLGSLGFAAVDRDARYFACVHRMPAGSRWSEAYGYQVDFEASGFA